MTFSIDQDRFPAIPAYRANWMPIYWEPMVGSGERLVVAIAAQGLDGNANVQPCIRPEVLKSLYGRQADKAKGFISLLLESVGSHLENGALSEWTPPTTGIFPGAIRSALAEDMRGILRQGIMLTSSIAHLADVDTEEDAEEADPGGIALADQWREAVKNEVVAINPMLGGYFDLPIELYRSGIPTRFGFLGSSLVAQFDVLRPDLAMSRLPHSRNKLWTLEQALETGHAQAGGLMLLTISPDDLLYSQKHHSAAESVLEQLHNEAETRNLSIYSCQSSRDGASALLGLI